MEVEDIGKKIFVIVNYNNYTKSQVQSELEQESFPYEFVFASQCSNKVRTLRNRLDTCNEVWYFGECENMKEYKLASELGCDIWKMG